MKKCSALIFAFFLVFFAANFSVRAENLEIVMPKIIYIGDTVEIRYIFHSEARLFDGELGEKSHAILNLRTDFDSFSDPKNDFAVKSASLEKTNSEYRLSLAIIPWKTGFCKIQPFSLTSLVAFSQNGGHFASSAPFMVSLSAIEVKSVVQKTKTDNFLPAFPPLTLPGTTGFLVLLSIFALILLSALLFALLRLPKIAHFLEQLSYLHSLKKNSRKTIKKLAALQRESEKILSDKDFAEEIQHILRSFLSNRFDFEFSSITTEKLYSAFEELSAGTLGEKQEETVENLVSLFSRLDYIRFAEQAAFISAQKNGGKSERFTIIQDSIKLVEDFDRDDEEETA